MADSSSLRIFIVAPVRLYRDGLADTLGREGLVIAGSHSGGDDLFDAIVEARPDVVLLDVTTPDCCTTARGVLDAAGVAVVALGVGASDAELLTYAEAGMTGYIASHSSVQDLVAGIASAARGELTCSPAIARRLMRRVASLSVNGTTAMQVPLTNREQQIAALLQRDLSNKDIAAALGIGVATVKHHVHRLLRHLGVERRRDAVVILKRAQRGVPTLVPRERQIRSVTQS